MEPTVAWIAAGRLRIRKPEAAPQALTSPFAESVRERALSIDRRHAWKAQGRGQQFMAGRMLWGGVETETEALGLRFSGVSAGRRPGEILYTLETQQIVALLARELGGDVETRLLHSNDHRLSFVSGCPHTESLACAVRHDSGTSGIGVMNADATDLTEVTEGDSVDLAPCWVPGERALVFQSAGIGRDRGGQNHLLGPAEVKRLDLVSGELATLLSSPDHDFLGPRAAADGSVLAIRRPGRGQHRVSFGRQLRDLLLLPFRLLYAIFQYLNFFSTRYTGKPLTTAGGPEQKAADARQMMVWGNLIDAREAARAGAARGEEAPALVPSSWQLVRRSPAGAVTVVASGVLAFDVGADGTVVWSNGNAIDYEAPDGTRRRLIAEPGIEHVAILRE